MPAASVHCTATVYTRPLPLPLRSARRFRVSGLVIWNGEPLAALIGSLLVTEAMWQLLLAPVQVSVAVTPIVTGTNL